MLLENFFFSKREVSIALHNANLYLATVGCIHCFYGVFEMLNYQSFVSRHCEFTAQALIEQMERYEGISPKTGASLEERWVTIMGMPQKRPAQAMAA